MADSISVEWTYPQPWRELPQVPLLASEPWHRAMAGRIEGEPVWFSADSPSDVGVGLAGFIVSDADAYVYGNAVGLLADPSSPFAPQPVRDALAADPPHAGDLFPHVVLTYPGYATFPVGHHRHRPDAVGDALAALVSWAQDQEIRALALPYLHAGSLLAVQARRMGFRGWTLTHDAILDMPAGGFPEYLSRLPHRRRTNIRAERRALCQRGLRGYRTDTVSGRLLDRMTDLRVQQRAKYGLPAERGAERARLERTLDLLGPLVDVFVVESSRQGARSEALCFALTVRDGDSWHGLYVGTDYTDPRSRGAYFEACFYAPIDAAAACGIRRLCCGLGTSEAKRVRGCRLVPVECLVLPLTPAAAGVVDAIALAWNGTAPVASSPSATAGGEQGA